jgi:hypothetical protein
VGMAYRLITALRIQLEPPPGVRSQEIIANLDGDGCNLLKSGVRPRAPKARIVDLRSGSVLTSGWSDEPPTDPLQSLVLGP